MKKLLIMPRFPAFTSRDFRYYWAAQCISSIGSQMQLVAINWQVYMLTHSAFALGFVGFTRFFPILLFSLIGGSFADAHNRKKIMIATQSTMTLVALVLTILTFTHLITATMIFFITAIMVSALAFDMPARQALVPSLVKKQDLPNALSLNSIMMQTSQIVGPAIAGVLIAKTNLAFIYGLNAISYLFILTTLYLIKTSGAIQGTPTKFSVAAVKEGVTFVRSKTMIWSTMLLDFFSTFFSSATALLPIFAKDILAVGPTGLGLLYSADSIGSVIAALFIAQRSARLRKQGMLLLVSVGFYALGTVMFGISHIFLLSFFALIVVGAGDGISTIIRNTIRQLETPDYIRGRMTSVNMIFFMGGPQLGDFEAGVLAGIIGAPLSVITGGVGTLLVVAAMAAFIPKLRLYDRHQVRAE